MVCFYDKVTDDVVTVGRFDFTIFDIDNCGASGRGKIEDSLLIDAAHPQFYRLWPTIVDSEVTISCEDGTAILPCGEDVRTIYHATTLGTGPDDLEDPNDHGDKQKGRSIAFQFNDTHCFEFTYDHYCLSEQIDESGDDTSCNGRYTSGNFLFAGAGDEIITDGVCVATPTLTPTVDPLLDLPPDLLPTIQQYTQHHHQRHQQPRRHQPHLKQNSRRNLQRISVQEHQHTRQFCVIVLPIFQINRTQLVFDTHTNIYIQK